MKPVARIYENQLLDDKVVTQEVINQMKSVIQKKIEECYLKSKTLTYKAEDWVSETWS